MTWGGVLDGFARAPWGGTGRTDDVGGKGSHTCAQDEGGDAPGERASLGDGSSPAGLYLDALAPPLHAGEDADAYLGLGSGVAEGCGHGGADWKTALCCPRPCSLRWKANRPLYQIMCGPQETPLASPA
jgi:hypothetical protein